MWREKFVLVDLWCVASIESIIRSRSSDWPSETSGTVVCVLGVGSRVYSSAPGADVKYRNGSVAIGNALFGPSVFAPHAFAKRWVTRQCLYVYWW